MNRRAIAIAAAGAALAFVAARARGAIAPAQASSSSTDWLSRTLAATFGSALVDNELAFLFMIREAEHAGLVADDERRYYTLFGGNVFLELDTHPGVRAYGEWLEPGKQNFTTAAGAYQITLTTWRRLAAKMGLQDFSRETQDAMALELIREAGALELVREGRFEEAVDLVNGIWASLPGAPYPQKQRSVDFVRSAYEAGGGLYA